MSSESTAVCPARVLSESANTGKPTPIATDKARDADSRHSLPMGNSKDMRAYEHERQKVKKAAELAKRKARKSSGWFRALHELRFHSSSPTASSEKHERLWLEDVDCSEGLECDPDVRWMPHSLPSRGVPVKREMKLTDLVMARKPRKSNVADGDFEVIPHVRSVIVLDDCVGVDPSVDEPWEYIRGQYEEDGIAGTRSYADILSAAGK